jgi:hypothetical protein
LIHEDTIGIDGGFLKWVYPQIIHFERSFHFHEINYPAIGVPPWLWKPPRWEKPAILMDRYDDFHISLIVIYVIYGLPKEV